jgi:hypothetical protein
MTGAPVAVRDGVSKCPWAALNDNMMAILQSGHLEFFDPIAGKFLGKIDLPPNTGHSDIQVEFSYDSRFVAIATGNTIFIFDLAMVIIKD